MDIQTLTKTFAERGITLESLPTGKAALKRIAEIIPDGASVMRGFSDTLDQLGFDEFAAATNWRNLRTEIRAEDDKAKREELRRQASLADYYIASTHALSEDGQLIWGSGSGSQLAGFAYTAKNCIWVVGKQKIVPDLPAAIDRLYNEVVPRHAAKWKMTPPENLSKVLIFEREDNSKRKLYVLLVDEELGW